MKKRSPGSAAGTRQADGRLRPLEKDVIEIFVRLAGLLRLPRSIGEIYGLLYLSPQPVPMETIRGRLRLSKGGTSMGLKTLRSFGAVRVEYVPGDRREHYFAEVELRKLAAGFLRDQVEPHLRSGRDRLVRIRAMLDDQPAGEKPFLRDRIERLENWKRRAERTIPLVAKIIRA